MISSLIKVKKTCVTCGYKGDFFDCGIKNQLFLDKQITGAGYRKNVTCPACGTNDRNRFVDYVLTNYTDIYMGEKTILHIAPEPKIREKILKNNKCTYIDGDLNEGAASQIVDATDMHFEDGTFDYIIFNHVFEHIPDERKAVKELLRCLKFNGAIIFSFPVCLDSDTYEDLSITSPTERENNFGQNDHVRLYGENDLKERFSKMGLDFEVIKASDVFTHSMIRKYSYPSRDFVFIGHHPGYNGWKLK